MALAHLGIDISKKTFDAALLTLDATPKHKKFDTPRRIREVHVCLEATGHYGRALAGHLFDSGHTVSVVNPAGPSAFARAQLSRTKTDKGDAIRIAQFCRAHSPLPWTPPSEEVATLQALVRRLESLGQMRQMESHRTDSAASAAVLSSIKAVLFVLDEQIALVEKQIAEHIDQHPDLKRQSDLLRSIPGIGSKTAAALLSELGDSRSERHGDWSRFSSARAAAAYVGVVSRVRESGTSVRGRSSMCKLGNARLRKALYFPAISGFRFNPVLIAMAERLAALGKGKMVILGAAMRRLIHLAFGVLKSGNH